MKPISDFNKKCIVILIIISLLIIEYMAFPNILVPTFPIFSVLFVLFQYTGAGFFFAKLHVRIKNIFFLTQLPTIIMIPMRYIITGNLSNHPLATILFCFVYIFVLPAISIFIGYLVSRHEHRLSQK